MTKTRKAYAPIDTDDFSDRKPVSLTKRRPRRAGREQAVMNSFDVVVYPGLVIAMVTGFNAGLLRSAVTILAYLIAMPIAVWAMSLIAPRIAGAGASPLTAEFAAVLRHVSGRSASVLGKLMRMALDETIGSEAGIGDRLAGAVAWRGARRPGRDHAGADFRSARSGRPPAGVPERLAAAAAAVGGRAKGFQVAAARGRGHDRSPEERPADLGLRAAAAITLPDMHFGRRRPLSGPSGLATVAGLRTLTKNI